MPHYHDYTFNDCKAYVRHHGIRRHWGIRGLPFRGGKIVLDLTIENTSSEIKKITYTWAIVRRTNGETKSVIPTSEGDSLTLEPHGANTKSFKHPRLINPGYHFLLVKFNSEKETPLIEFDIPRVQDALIASWGWKILYLAIGAGVMILINWIGNAFR